MNLAAPAPGLAFVMHWIWTSTLLATLQTPVGPAPATSVPLRADEPLRSVQATEVDDGAITVDGHVHDAAWAATPAFPPLIQTAPRFGFPASEETVVRLAYDTKGLYVGFECQMDPAEIRAPFFVRDRSQPSDLVFVEFDPGDDDTNGFYFAVSASGAIVDAQLSRDIEEERLWDGVWRSQSTLTKEGWSAEIFVPWSTLRFPKRGPPRLAINVGRVRSRGNETARLNAPPQGVPGRLSFAIPVDGIQSVATPLNLEFRPFASLRGAIRRPQDTLDDTWRALPNAGLDLKYGISGTLTLDVTANPDFGQAEVDAAFLNLGPFEVFLPEKRQFFLESRDIFNSGFNLFYSRRIGAAPRPSDVAPVTRTVNGVEETGTLQSLDPVTRIAAAARVTGEVAPGWILGAITATTAPTNGEVEFSDGTRDRARATETTQWSAVRLRRQFDSQSYLGMLVTHVGPMRGEDYALVGSVDYQVRFRERWTQSGQVIATNRKGTSGMGANTRLSHRSPNTHIHLGAEMLTPNADFNRMGFMPFADFNRMSFGAHLFNAQPVGQRIRELHGQVHSSLRVDFQGRITQKLINTEWRLQTLGLWRFNLTVGGHFPELDPYETRGNIPYEVPIHWWAGLDVSSPSDRRVVVNMGTSYGEQAGKPGPDARIGLSLRPVDRLRLDLGTEINTTFGRPRWVAEREVDAMPIFGTANTTQTAADLRLTVGIRPRMSLSLWNRLFYATATHDRFFELRDPSTLVLTDAAPWQGTVDVGSTSLVLNAIFRWEYLPGSFLFATYTHRSLLNENGTVRYRPGAMFSNLGAATAAREDTVFLKVMHLFSL